jgi:hypothetical protein
VVAKALLVYLDARDWTIEKLDRCVSIQAPIVRPTSERSASPMARTASDLLRSTSHSIRATRLRQARSLARKDGARSGDPGVEIGGHVLANIQARSRRASLRRMPPARSLEADPGGPCETVNPQSFDTWLKPTRFDGKTLVVHIPHPDFTHVTDKWGDLISRQSTSSASRSTSWNWRMPTETEEEGDCRAAFPA